MKKNIFLSLFIVVAIFMITGCINNQKTIDDIKENTTNAIHKSEVDNNMIITNIKVSINGQDYNAILEDNETAQTFVNLLPQDFNMIELNGNEKYIYMDKSLPTNSSNPKHIEAGDIMLYGNDCLVIFFKSFNTSYSYTKIGHIENLPDLGNGNINVKLKK